LKSFWPAWSSPTSDDSKSRAGTRRMIDSFPDLPDSGIRHGEAAEDVVEPPFLGPQFLHLPSGGRRDDFAGQVAVVGRAGKHRGGDAGAVGAGDNFFRRAQPA